jgi:hypothetical protein
MDSHIRYIGGLQKRICSFHPVELSNKPNKKGTGSQIMKKLTIQTIQNLKVIHEDNLDMILQLPQGLRLKIPGSQRSLTWDPYILNPKTLFPASLIAGQYLLRSHFPW